MKPFAGPASSPRAPSSGRCVTSPAPGSRCWSGCRAPADSGSCRSRGPDRDTLKERVKPGATVGEEVLGAYEVRGGRPVTVAIEEGQVVLKMGQPRLGANPVTPEKMLRKAAAEAETRAKTRFKDRGR